ncbi:NACHT, LRR and PYD domains-containing protein 1a-like [Eleutherodactylus coqui]|uniref:NACHT, LRR and PYD domains-containing protein 1a-like n=1 Tax=Eleutherodactylus coqui TaxID=57060 RepID=UPI003463641C
MSVCSQDPPPSPDVSYLVLREQGEEASGSTLTSVCTSERRFHKEVGYVRSSGNALQRLSKNKAIVGIFSREADSQYSWLVGLLLSDVFMDDIAEVRPCRIRNSGWQQFHQDVSRCTFGILYHSKNGERINVTDVNGSLYDEELEHLYSRLGKKKVIVVIDDLSDSSDQQKTNILRNQPSIMNMAEDLFLISHEEKTSSYQRRPMVDREQVRRKLQMVKKIRKRKNDYKKNTGGSLQWIMHQIASHITSSLSGMSEPYPETADNISSTKLIAEHIMASSFSAKGTDTSDLVPQVTGDNKYRIEVETKVIIECSVQSGTDYMNLNQKNDYELLGPTVNEQGDSGTVSAVHLPLYICPDGLKDQSMITFDFKDWKTVLKTPTSTKPSVVLKHPNFSCVTATVEQDKSINGKVILYFRVVCPEKEDHMEYRIHLYLLYPDIPHLKDLDDLKRDHGFNRIDKPSQTTGSVYTETNYMICLIGGKRNRSIWPKVLQFIVHKEINNHPFAEINISKNAILKSANPISLQVVAENSSELEPVWECRLSRADIEEASGQAVQRGITPEHFVDKHRVQLIEKVRYIKPVLDDLKKKGLLKEEQCSIITSQLTPQDQMRELLCFVQFWGRKDKDTFYKIVKCHNEPIIKEMERKN